MGEFAPFLFGCVIGAALIRLPRKGRMVIVPVACIVAGALASAVNGELASDLWLGFISFDSVLVWIGLAVTMATLSLKQPSAGP
jgi:hypothetical protein